MISRNLFFLFNFILIFSIILNIIPFTLRQYSVIFIFLFTAFFSTLSIISKFNIEKKMNLPTLSSWEYAAFFLIILPVVTTESTIAPKETKLFIFTSFLVLFTIAYIRKINFFSLEKYLHKTIWVIFFVITIFPVFLPGDQTNIVRTNIDFITIDFNFGFSNIFTSPNHYSAFLGLITFYLINTTKNKLIRFSLLSITLVVFVIVNSLISLTGFIIIFLFGKIIFRLRVLFFILTLASPIIFSLYSAIIFAIIGFESDTIFTLNNRLPMWVGLYSEFISWDLKSIFIGKLFSQLYCSFF